LLVVVFFSFQQVHFFFKHFCNNNVLSHPHVFLEKLFHLSSNRKSILSLLEFSNLFLLQVLDNKGYNAWFVYFEVNFCIIIDRIKIQTQR
jgi:hypothetical protein